MDARLQATLLMLGTTFKIEITSSVLGSQLDHFGNLQDEGQRLKLFPPNLNQPTLCLDPYLVAKLEMDAMHCSSATTWLLTISSLQKFPELGFHFGNFSDGVQQCQANWSAALLA